LAVLPMYKI